MEVSHELTFLNSARCQYLRQVSQPRGNSLRLVVDEAVEMTSDSARDLDRRLANLRENLTNVSAIETTESRRSFELIGELYVAYLVNEECAGSCGNYDDETFRGALFRIYSNPHFLDHLARDTGAHTRPIQHYKVTCLNHLNDVASYAPPVIRVVAVASSN